MNNKVLLAMSGGIDSSISVQYLINGGFDVTGTTFNMIDNNCKSFNSSINGIISDIVNFYNIKHIFVDVSEDFNNHVICKFIDDYIGGKTPNPCTICNKDIKFKYLNQIAQVEDCYHIATGHYARIDSQDGRYFIKKGIDKTKDQSYFLWKLSQDVLSKTIFPLGNTLKKNNKILAQEIGLDKYTQQEESNDICFLKNDSYREFLLRLVPSLKDLHGGDLVYHGKVVGNHDGYPFYTIGQRSGIGVAVGHPVFVQSIDCKTNVITLCDEEELYTNEMIVSNVNLQKYENINEYECTVKIRYRDVGHKALLKKKENGKILCSFYEQVKAITPGQSAVFYEDDDVIGGGIIN